MASITKITINDVTYDIGFMKPGPYVFSGWRAGAIKGDGRVYFTVPFNRPHNFESAEVTFCKAYVQGVQGTVKYANSASDGLTDFRHTNFKTYTGLYFDHIDISFEYLKTPPPQNCVGSTPVIVSFETGLKITFS